MMEVKLEIAGLEPFPFQHVLLHQKHLLSLLISLSGTTTDTSLPLTVTVHTLHQTVEKMFDIKH